MVVLVVRVWVRVEVRVRVWVRGMSKGPSQDKSSQDRSRQVKTSQDKRPGYEKQKRKRLRVALYRDSDLSQKSHISKKVTFF